MGLMEGTDGHDGRRLSSIDSGHMDAGGESSTPSNSQTAGAGVVRALRGGVGSLKSLITARGGSDGGGAAAGARAEAEGPPAWEQSLQLSHLGQLAGASPPAAAAAGASFSSDHNSEHPVSREASETTSTNSQQLMMLAPGSVPPIAGGSLTGSLTGSLGSSSVPAHPMRSFDAALNNGAPQGALSRGVSLGSSSAADGHPHHSMLVRPTAASGLDGTNSYGSTRRSKRNSQSRFFSMLLGPSGGSGSGGQDARLFYGLRVRMGVSSGVLAANVDVRNSPVLDLAKGGWVAVDWGLWRVAGTLVDPNRIISTTNLPLSCNPTPTHPRPPVVSDLGNGGQVLIDSATFDQVKDRLQELGAVDHYGYNDRLLVRREQGRTFCPGGSGACR
jgi:hypothetical protein